MNNIIIITGQTATGKSSYAHKLAKEHNGELINCDSRQVYKYLDIVTGKVTFNDVYTHLLSIVDPKQPFSSSEWSQKAKVAIHDISGRGKTPIIVGGTYLYIKNLLYGFETDHIGPDWRLRRELDELSIQDLQDRLEQLDKSTYERMNHSDQHNPRRLMRKIEIACHLERSKAKSRDLKDSSTLVGMTVFIGLRFKDEEKLRNTIEQRVHERIKAGAVEETRELLSRGYTKTDPGLQTIDYKQIIQFLEKKISEEEMIRLWITAEVQYAKRQYTFMKKDTHIAWRDV